MFIINGILKNDIFIKVCSSVCLGAHCSTSEYGYGYVILVKPLHMQSFLKMNNFFPTEQGSRVAKLCIALLEVVGR
jgi:hypothetical protein